MKREQGTADQAEFVYGHYASVESLKGTQEINKVWLQTGLQDKIRNEITQLAKKGVWLFSKRLNPNWMN